MLKPVTILPCLLLMFQPLNAKVEPPNYDFSLDALEVFMPGKSLSDAQAKHGQPELISSQLGMKTHRFKVAHIRYKFSALVQEQNGTIHDFFAKLPSYFLHDVFFQGLVKRLGKQTSYTKVGEEAHYIWKVGGNWHVYSAACTITCFPVFYSVEPLNVKVPSTLNQMSKSSKKR